ncbi:MAG TPA: Ycf66 family protein [Candidatus Caenarcaniphilales bacterium]
MVNVGLSTGSILGLGSTLTRPLLAQVVNVGFGPAGILGIIVAVAGAALYFLRSVRPELARDHDIFFAAVGLLCGGVLFFQGWRLDPILLFGQLLLTATSVFFAVESIRLRSVATVQAKRSTQIFEEDRPVKRNYQYAELDFDPDDDAPPVRRIGGTREGSSSRSRATYVDELEGDTRQRRPARKSSGENRPTGEGRPRKRPASRPTASRPDVEVPERPARDSGNYQRNSGPARSGDKSRGSETAPRSRKSRTRPESPPDTTPPSNYVDYQSVDYSDYMDQEQDNSANFDDFDEGEKL